MIQLSLFEKPKPSLPDFEFLSYIAGRLKIRVTKKDRKDVVSLFLRCMKKIKPMMDYFDKMAREHGLDEYISPEYFLFFVENEKAARNLAGESGLR